MDYQTAGVDTHAGQRFVDLIKPAVSANQMGPFALVEVVLFIATVLVAYLYVLKRGGLTWD